MSVSQSPAPLLRVALAGQPNVGKSVIFNLLTGGAQHVANWPGKTTEQASGVYRRDGLAVEVVDLPGTYSLTANSPDECLARDYLLREKPHVVAVIVDAAALERNLYLVAELLALPVPLVLGLNRIDLAEQQGIHVEPHVLQAAIGLRVVPMVANRGEGLHELMAAAEEVARGDVGVTPNRPQIRADHREVLERLTGLIGGCVPAPYPADWVALKLLEGDEEISGMMRSCLYGDWEAVHAILREHEDAVLAVASGRYEWIGRMVRAAITRPRLGQITLTDRLDRLATHPLWGMLILTVLLGVSFWITYAAGDPAQEWLDLHVVQAGAVWLHTVLAPAPVWVGGMLADGVMAGMGTLLTFLPVLVIFFGVLGLLEDVGYIARAAYLTDRFMHVMGLHGRSFLPLFLGFGCNVPAVMAARTIDSPRARLLTILLAPLIPCPARMTVIAVLAPVFFGRYAPLVAFGLLGLSMIVLAVVGIGLHELLLGGEHLAFVMEMPLYHAPDWRAILRSMWLRIVDFLQVAGSTILIVSVLLWALSYLPAGNIETSYLAQVGRLFEPIGRLMGWGWQMMVALLTSFVRKENVIATLGVLYGSGRAGAGLPQTLQAALTPASSLSFLVVQMLFIPCVATLATIRRETHSWRWTLGSVALLLVISFGTGILTYHAARWLGL
jgi:ferrous iron transport protein B